MNHVCHTIVSKHPVIIRILFLLIVCHATTTSQKKLPNSPISNYKTKITLIVYITKAINTL